MSSTLEEGENGALDDVATLSPPEALQGESTLLVLTARDTPFALEQDVEDADLLPSLEPSVEDINLDDEGEIRDHVESLDGLTHKNFEVNSDNIDDTLSIPDHTPSVQGSFTSPPRSDTASLQSPRARQSPPNAHRAFDRRFQTRLSQSPLGSPRAGSPAFLGTHSRQSSLASVGVLAASEPDDSTAPWDVIRWTKQRKVTGQAFSEVGKRNFGRPTCLAVTDNIVIGTSKGIILVFDYQQTPKASIGFGTKAVECGAVTSLAISADHTTIAAGYAEGHIYTWEVARPARPFLHIPPIDLSQPQARKSDGHVLGTAVLHVGFLGYRRTAVVSADDKGMAFSHLATRGMGAVARTVRTTRVLGRYPELLMRGSQPRRPSSVLAFSPLPLGNIEQGTDSLGLVAMMTPYLLVIVSTTPVAQTQHKAARPKEVAAHSAMSAALAWFPAIKLKVKDAAVSKTKLVYCWSNVLTVLEVEEVPTEGESTTNKPPDLQIVVRSRWKTEESIVAVQWLSRSVLAVLTITQQLMILEDVSMHVTDSFDLLPKNTFHADLYSQQLQSLVEQLNEEDSSMHGVVADAFHMSFRAYKGRLFLLGFNDVCYGSLTNWADRLLALIESGDFIGAIQLATTYYGGQGEKATIGLPEEDVARQSVVKEKLLEIISASLKYAFGRNQQAGNPQLDLPQMTQLATACVAACMETSDQDFLFDEVYSWFEDHDHASILLDVLEPHILDRQITSLPPTAVKALIEHFMTTHTSSNLEEIICMLDTSTIDIDQMTSLCKKYNLYDAYIYVWNSALVDYVSPLEVLLKMVVDASDLNGHTKTTPERQANAHKMFPYMSYVLTGRIYPTGLPMDDTLASEAKQQLYSFLFSGQSPHQRSTMGSKQPFNNLRKILVFDTASFMSVLNEAFEDSYLNQRSDQSTNGSFPISHKTTNMNRQHILIIMLEVMSSKIFDAEDSIYLDMFIARNLPKYSQYILLSGTTLHEIFIRLCQYPVDDMADDAELSAEYLNSVYHPSDIMSLVPLLQKAQFYRLLKSVFRQEREYSQLVETFFQDPNDKESIFEVIADCLRAGSPLNSRQRAEVLDVVKRHADDLMMIDVERSAVTINRVAPDLHKEFLSAQSNDPHSQFQYLQALLEPPDQLFPRNKPLPYLVERYIQLMCEYNSTHVAEFVEALSIGDLRLQEVLPTMEKSGAVDAAVVLLVRQGQAKAAMERLIKHFNTLQAALYGLSQNSQQGDGSSTAEEAFDRLITSIDKYAKVGIWLCQGQTKSARQPKPLSTSAKRAAGAKPVLSFEENLWLDLVNSTVAIAKEASCQTTRADGDNISSEGQAIAKLRRTTQQVFTALLTTAISTREGSTERGDFSFLRILRAFLTHAAASSPSLTELRSVIDSIFSAYAYEESLRTLANTMLDKDLFVHVDEVTRLRQQGWRPRGQICEVCRRRVWGPSLGEGVWESWQKKEQARIARRQIEVVAHHEEDSVAFRGKGKAAIDAGQQLAQEEDPGKAEDSLSPVLVFSCRHIFHQRCLTRESGKSTFPPGGVDLTCPMCV